MLSILEQLVATDLFASVQHDTLEKLAKETREVTLEKGAVLFSKGDDAKAAFLILEGQVAIECHSSSGRTTRIATLGPNDLLGELAVITDIKRTADARAVKKCILLRINGKTLRQLVTDNADFSTTVIEILVARIGSSNMQIEGLATISLRERLAILLSDAASTEVDSTLKITQSELADRLSVTREEVNNCLLYTSPSPRDS